MFHFNLKEVMNTSLKVEVPASIANIGPCFDIASVAISLFKDEVEVIVKEGTGKVEVEVINKTVPEGNQNTAYGAAKSIIESYNVNNLNVLIKVKKGIPIAAGLGSSGATAAAVTFGLSKLLSIDLNKEEMVYHAGNGESIVSGVPHYDNVSASLFGGVVLVDPNTMKVIRLNAPNFHLALITPKIEFGNFKTKLARSILPKTIDIRTHVMQSFQVAKLITGILNNDLKLIGEAASSDLIVEKERSKLIPFYWEAKKLALSEGALGFNISGAGPTVFAVCSSESTATNVAKSVSSFFISHGVEASHFVTTPSQHGAKVVERGNYNE
ncbi:MAG: homoserine kinase [Thermoproteota archaeon]